MHDSVRNIQWRTENPVEYSLIQAPQPDLRNSPWCMAFWREWLLEPEKDEETLRKYTRSLSGAFQGASWRNDIEAMLRLLEVHDFGFRYCYAEPLLTQYELTLLYMAYIVADRHFLAGRLEACLADLGRIEQTLAEGDARRESCGMEARPNSELRLNIIGLRAGCLADPLAAEPIEPAGARLLGEQFWRIADALVERLQTRSEVQRTNLLSIISVREIEVCKLAYRANTELFAEAVCAFNNRYGADLTTDPPRGTYQAALATSWFWDLEVWKHLHQSPRDADALIFCMRAREKTMTLNYGKNPANCIKAFWNRQAQAA